MAVYAITLPSFCPQIAIKCFLRRPWHESVGVPQPLPPGRTDPGASARPRRRTPPADPESRGSGPPRCICTRAHMPSNAAEAILVLRLALGGGGGHFSCATACPFFLLLLKIGGSKEGSLPSSSSGCWRRGPFPSSRLQEGEKGEGRRGFAMREY